MKRISISFLALFAILCSCSDSGKVNEQPLKIIEPVDFSHIQINDNFWSP